MKVSETQVERSIAALRRPDPDATPVPKAARPPEVELPAGLIDLIEATPAVRPEVVAAARARIDLGEQPSADDVADKVVGRLVCDRLR